MKNGRLRLMMLGLITSLGITLAACGGAGESAAPAQEAESGASSAASVPAETSASGEEATSGAAEEDFSNAAGYEDVPLAEDLLKDIPEGKTIRLGYMSDNETIQFCHNMSMALMDEAEKYNGKVTVEMVDARGLAPQQVSQAEDMIVKKVDVCIVHPIDQDACAPALDKLAEAGIPIINISTNTVNRELATSYIGVDDKEAGILATKMIAEALGEKGTVNVIKGLLGDPANEKRMIGLEEEIGNHPGLNVNSMQAADWDRGKAMSLTEDWLSSGKDFQGVIAMNDEMAISSALALNAAGKDVKVIGVDGIDEALEMIKNGELYGTAFQDADRQGRAACDVAVAIALGKEVEENYIIPYEAITAENVDEFLN